MTYNPDVTRLEENIKAIKPQVERLLIFDNGSENIDKISLTGGCSAELIRGGENYGMAVALNRLAEVAEEGGATDIVFLDQDTVASDDLVCEERKLCGDDIGLVCCLSVDRNHVDDDADRGVVCDITRAITSGSMVNLAAWRKVGGYDERLFVDWVDNEFSDNLRAHGYGLVKTSCTHILHEMGNQVYAWSAPGGDDMGKKHARRGYYRQNYPAWRWRDRARSQAITIRKYGFSRIGWEERYYFLKATIGRIILLEGHKVDCLKAAIGGYICGCRVAR